MKYCRPGNRPIRVTVDLLLCLPSLELGRPPGCMSLQLYCESIAPGLTPKFRLAGRQTPALYPRPTCTCLPLIVPDPACLPATNHVAPPRRSTFLLSLHLGGTNESAPREAKEGIGRMQEESRPPRHLSRNHLRRFADVGAYARNVCTRMLHRRV